MAQELTQYTSASALESAKWKGTSRYELVRCVGSGAMGVVYEVHDRERGQALALKTLLHFGPAGLHRFKREFRTLADVHHRNLVRLYELVIEDGGDAFFTMELLRGKEFTQYAWAGAPKSGATNHETGSTRAVMRADESRLRSALRQLTAGVGALHAAGILHRDIKPANALVTDAGRVVLLDFGVATELSAHDMKSSEGVGQIVGTPAYMAPEQAEDRPPTPAADWYSVGVMLYEALVGAPPFQGSTLYLLFAAKKSAAPLPSARVDGVPPDLDALCQALLSVDPSKRPHGQEILRRLGVGGSFSSAPPSGANGNSVEQDAQLIGRERPLRMLAEAFESAGTGRTVTAFVTGASGIGKTRLVKHFLDDLVLLRQAVVLRGRAYEREAVPYKAFDTLMDSLSRHLISLLEAGQTLPLPEDFWLLGRLFSVFQRIPALGGSADRSVHDPQTVRRRAFAALRELLGALSKRSPIVVFVDDVHWGDADSAALFLELVRPSSSGGILMVMTYQETKEASPFLSEVKERWPAQADRVQIPVGPLATDDAQRLALVLLGEHPLAHRVARAVARTSKGHPFLIEELVRANRGHLVSPEKATLAVLSVDQMVRDRLERLPEAARRLAEVVAVAARPLPLSVAIRAAELDPEAAEDLVAMAYARRLVRAGLHGGRDVLEPTYDPIRRRLVAQLPKDGLVSHHRSLALALEDVSDRDGEAIAEHWLGAGDPSRAASVARDAAELAFARFAFDQCVRLLRLALSHTPPSSPDVHALRVRLAQALQMNGLSTESGRQYLQAVATAPPGQKLELRRAAAEQLLTAGHFEEGEPILHDVLASCGMRAPRSPQSALFWLIVYSLWIWLRGYGFKERDPADVSDEDRMRVEALYTAGIGFGFVNSILSICMQKRQWIEAQRVGDRGQVVIALAAQISHMGNAHARPSKRERALVAMTRDLAKRAGQPILESYVDAAAGFGRFFRGQWAEARELLERAEIGMRRSGHRILAVNARMFADYTYFFAGDFAEYRRRGSRMLAEAEERGDLYTTVTMRLFFSSRPALAAGETAPCRRRAREVIAQWPGTFSVQHFIAMYTLPDLDVYDGEGARAYDMFMQSLPALEKSMLLGNVFARVMTRLTHGRLAIASIASRPKMRESRIAEARKMARLLAREPNAWARSLGSFVTSAAELAAGDRDAAIAELRRTVELSAVADTGNTGLLARYRLGEVLGDEEGREHVRKVTETLRVEWGVKDVKRYVHTLLPGEFEPG